MPAPAIARAARPETAMRRASEGTAPTVIRRTSPAVARAEGAAPLLPPLRLKPTDPVLPSGMQAAGLHVSSPGEPAEREAEAVARQVVRMPQPAPHLARTPAATLPRATAAPPVAGPSTLQEIRESLGGGMPLPQNIRGFMEPRFRADFGGVRIHAGERAARLAAPLGARAFTFGRHIFFGRGQWRPETQAGAELLAHELVHTVQQGKAIQRQAEAAAAPRIAERSAPGGVQCLGIGDVLDYFATKANIIPGYRMFTILIGVNPINMSRLERSAANILRAIVEFIPGGGLIVQALDRYGIFDRAGAWVEQRLETLGITAAVIRRSIDQFLDSLGWRDIFSLGDVWERAKRIFTEPIRRIIDFAGSLLGVILDMVKEAILRPLAGLASRTPAWDLLCAVLGRNPITGEAVPRTADTLIGGFMKLIGQPEVWENLKRANAVSRAWTWFQTTLSGVLAFVRELPQRFLDTLRSLSIVDLVAPVQAFARVAGTFAGFVGQFLSWAGGQVMRLLEIIFEVVAPAVMPYLKRAAGAFEAIIRDPIRFIGNLVRAVVQGFRQFGANILDHLRGGLIGWLTGAMAGAGVYIPQALSLQEILKFVLSVLRVTWTAVRARLVRAVGDPAVRGMEAGFDLVRTLVTQGPAAAWQQIVEAVGNLHDMVVEQVMGFVRSRIVQAAITRLIASLNPAGAFIQAILAIYNTMMFLIERMQQIAQVAASVIDSISAIASGVIGAAASRVEQTMARLLPLVIAFLARLIGLGNVGEVVTRFLDRVRAPIERALDRLVGWVVAQARRLGRFALTGATPARRNAEPTAEERARLDGALAAAHSMIAERGINLVVAEQRLGVIRQRFGLTELRLVKIREGAFAPEAVINPRRRGPPDPLFTEAQLANLRRLGQDIAQAINAHRRDNWPAEYRADKLGFLRNPRRVNVGQAVEEAGAPVVEQVAEEGGFTMLRNVALNLVDGRGQVLGGTQAELDYLVLGRRRVEEVVSAKLNPAQLSVATDRRHLAHYRDFPGSGSLQQIQQYARDNFGRTPLWNNAVGAIVTFAGGSMPLRVFKDTYLSHTVVESVTVRVLSPSQPAGARMPAIPLRANEEELFQRLAQSVDENLR